MKNTIIDDEIRNTKLNIKTLTLNIKESTSELENLIGYLKGLEKAYSLLKEKTHCNETQKIHLPLTYQYNQGLKSGSELARIEEILTLENGYLHLNDIMAKLGIYGQKKKISLAGSLNRYSNEKKVFTRLGRNVFGLIKFEKK